MTNRQPALDPDLLTALRELADGDAAFLHELLESFERDSATYVRQLHGAQIFGNRVAFGRNAHALAGAAMNIGATTLVAMCRENELAMSRGGVFPTVEDFQRILDEINRVLYEARDLSMDSYLEAVRAS